MERCRDRTESTAVPVPEEVRPGKLRPRCVHPILVHAYDGLPGRADFLAVSLGRLATTERHSGHCTLVSVLCHMGSRHALCHEHGRLAADGKRPAALGRPGAPEDLE